MDLTDTPEPPFRYRHVELPGAADGDERGSVLIYDPENEHAWIRSSRVVSLSDEGAAGSRERLQYDPQTESYHLTYDWRVSEPLSTLIITAIADITGNAPTDLEPLYDRIDPDALDRLFSPNPDGSLGAAGPVTFTFHGHEVTVERHGHVVIRPRRDEA